MNGPPRHWQLACDSGENGSHRVAYAERLVSLWDIRCWRLHHRHLALLFGSNAAANSKRQQKDGELTSEVTWERQQGSISMRAPPGKNSNELRETESDPLGPRMASDLDRLEALIAWHVREQWAPKLPRAAQLEPVLGIAHAGERFDDDDPPPPWLKPQHLTIPPAIMRHQERASSHRGIGRISIWIVGVCALPIAYYFVSGSEIYPLTWIVTKPTVTTALSPSLPVLAKDDEAEHADANESAARAGQPRAPMFSERLAMVKPDDPGIGPLSPKPPVRTLDADTITLLMTRGEQLLEAGDFAAARTLFQRAAEADNAAAAIALGATYDPIVLARMHAVGIDADVSNARFWYQKAVSLGSSDARRRLELLANRQTD
jgi:hypothetical protein